MAKGKPSIFLLKDPRYLDFCAKYRGNLVGYILDHSRNRLTWQQLELAEAIQEPGCRVATASGHGTGKTWLLAFAIDWHMRVYPFSNGLLTAPNIEQTRIGVWKYLDEVQADMDRARPWMKGYFIKKTRSYFMKHYKDSWYFVPKTASKSAPEGVAGQHNKNYMCIVDEASGVIDEIHGVLRGALTEEENRYVMMSQPTRIAGHFADAFGKLKDIYRTFNLNSELSPLVSKKFIREKLTEYGGHHSPEYQIKVLGLFPDNMSGYLIPKRWLEICQDVTIKHDEAWGWVVTVDVAEGVHRDSSVWTIAKVSGFLEKRKVEVVECVEFLDLNEKEFARRLYNRCLKLENPTVAVDGDGAGRTVILELEDLGMQVEAIHWGLPCHSEADKRRYKNLRAYSSVKLRESVFEERIKVAANKKIVDQGSKIPYDLDDKGRYTIWPKERMRSNGIKSPDVFDTHCFFYLVDYIPVEAASDDYQDEMIKWAKQIIEGDAAA